MHVALLLVLAQDPVTVKCWEAARSSLEKLGVKDLEAAKASYLKSAANFEKGLAALPKEVRDRIEAAKDPFEAIEIENATLKQKLWPPSIRDLVPKAVRPKLGEGEGAATLKKIVGAWTNDWPSAGMTTNWTIAEDGSVAEEVVRKSGTKTEAIKIDFAHEMRMGVKRGTTRQDYVFFLARDVFYASSNLLYDVHRVPDRKNFTIPCSWDWLVVKDGAYTAIGDSGVTAPVTAVTSDKEISLKWRYAGKKYDTTCKYLIVGEYLVHSSAQEFRRKK